MIADHEYTSLQEILDRKEFSGKTVFVDMWGTTCKPCIVEFGYADELKERYENKPVEFLYLCIIDRIDHKVRWKEIIKQKQLRGTHVAIDEMLYESIWLNDLGDEVADKFLIPHYFIVKDGKIVIYQAARPSSKEKLYDQIDSVLNQN